MDTVHKTNERNNSRLKVADSMTPKGIHHTVSYAVSFNDTWNHIRNELRKTYQQVHLQ